MIAWVIVKMCVCVCVLQVGVFPFLSISDCDISFVGCKFVSGHHCSMSRDPDGNVWLEDLR